MTAKTNTKTVAAKKTTDAAPKTFTLADLSRKMGIDPKIARAKARRHEPKFKKLRAKGEDGWVFPNTNRNAVSELLKAGAAA